MSFKLSMDDMQKKFARAAEDFPVYFDTATDHHTDAVFAETKVRVPKKTGALEATGIVEEHSTKNHFRFIITYGGGDVDYAAAVHEILKASHAPPTGAKYVEQPLIESIPALKVRLQEAAKKAKAYVFK